MNKMRYQIGDMVNFSQCFPRRCRDRFPITHQGYATAAQPIRHSFIESGFVVGLRSVIMDDYSPGDWDSDDGYYLGSEGGIRETVLLVSPSMTRNPVLVRLCDVTDFKRVKR